MSIKNVRKLGVAIGALGVGIAGVVASSTATDANQVSWAASRGSARDTITLNYWSMWNKGEPQQIVLQKIMDEFQQKYPYIHISVQWAGRQVLTKVQQTVISGNPPDIIDKDENEAAATLVKSNQAVPLDGILGKKIDGENDTINQVIAKTPLHFYDQGGHIYEIPYELITSGIWYNENLFKKYGLTPPKTWSEFIAVCAQLKAHGVAPVAADGSENFFNSYWYYWLSDRILGPKAFQHAVADKTGKSWNNSGFLKVAEYEHQLVSSYMAPGYQGSKWPAGQVAWAQGKAGMLVLGSWAPSETHSYAAKGFKYRMFPFPTVNSNVSSSTDVETYLVGWSIPKGSAHVDAAEKFILFAMNKSRLAGISNVAQNITSRLDIPAPSSLQDAQSLFKHAVTYHPVNDGVDTVYPDFWQTVFLPLDDKLFFNQISPKDFISQLQQQTKSYWQSH